MFCKTGNVDNVCFCFFLTKFFRPLTLLWSFFLGVILICPMVLKQLLESIDVISLKKDSPGCPGVGRILVTSCLVGATTPFWERPLSSRLIIFFKKKTPKTIQQKSVDGTYFYKKKHLNDNNKKNHQNQNHWTRKPIDPKQQKALDPVYSEAWGYFSYGTLCRACRYAAEQPTLWRALGCRDFFFFFVCFCLVFCLIVFCFVVLVFFVLLFLEFCWNEVLLWWAIV